MSRRQTDNTNYYKVKIRDLNLCRCCGFKANEVHHVLPVIYGGSDDETNLISICHTCHKYAPDSPKEFFEYAKKGGYKTTILWGMLVEASFKAERESKGELSFIEAFNLGKEIYSLLKELNYKNAIENETRTTD